MISIRWFREDFEDLLEKYKGCNVEESTLLEIKSLDKEVLEIKGNLDQLRAQKNQLSKEYGQSRKEGGSPDPSGSNLKDQIAALEREYEEKKSRFDQLICSIPAIPDPDVPDQDTVVKEWGVIDQTRSYKPYIELVSDLKLIDFKEAVSVSGSGHSVYVNKGEKLFRSLISFTLDWAESNGFQRRYLPVLVNEDSLFCTSQLSKFSENLFRLGNSHSPRYLSPTAEVQLVNLYRKQIIPKDQLPIKLCANTNCFRNEKIGAGSESRGIIRQYQFCKTEIIMMTLPEESEKTQEYMSTVIEGLLQALQIPYRKLLLSKTEMSFASSKTYDFEAWMPGEGKYREISSLSNTRDFQSLRGKIRYKADKLNASEKSEYVHILNGSCLAIDRLFAVLLENHQTPEGEVKIPECLVRYFGEEKIVKP
ncbi:seryl-tRNA synthetase [Candidatus Mycoplasma haematolamae str. Purdue]|uniref:Serine--tRNA ligase n=1 Tax=Mycoplasma haematolamae (strain Purdue) TaxID=1212765 RepID=I7CKW7_MYCHA|nr:serine--tRNA ligase [Candidatus Mycoplasma haematolamae]AFO52499.1 seryl-tRNA synthetase [Candidatus Mycoplasma haematolamae str. Purdue]